MDDAKEPLMDGTDRERCDTDWESGLTARGMWRRNKPLPRSLVFGLVALPWTLLVLLGLWSWHSLTECKARYYIRPDLIYSPLQDLVRYETKIFTTGLPEDTDFSPYALEPSDEVDKVWTELYPSLHQLIPQEQAAKLVNGTILYPHDEQKRYVIELDVFHQLHCLNMVRKATRPDYYKPQIPEGATEDPLLARRHITHCIDAIRQSLMCSSDITPYTWKWDPEEGSSVNNVKNPHTCRNFDVLRDWSRVHTNQVFFDFGFREPNDPLDPSTWIDGFTGK